jgi:hypothetical protein
MDVTDVLVKPVKEFAKSSARLVKRCTKPDRKGACLPGARGAPAGAARRRQRGPGGYASEHLLPLLDPLQSSTRSQLSPRWASSSSGSSASS